MKFLIPPQDAADMVARHLGATIPESLRAHDKTGTVLISANPDGIHVEILAPGEPKAAKRGWWPW